jgi:hypothetical protein
MQHQTPCLQYQKKKNPPKAPPSNLAPQPIPNLFFSGDCYTSLWWVGANVWFLKSLKLLFFLIFLNCFNILILKIKIYLFLKNIKTIVFLVVFNCFNILMSKLKKYKKIIYYIFKWKIILKNTWICYLAGFRLHEILICLEIIVCTWPPPYTFLINQL